MNEFEIKTLQESLKSLGVIDVYNISKEYNMQCYGQVIIKAIIEYVYKNESYLIYYAEFEKSETMNKIEVIKLKIESEIKKTERLFYSKETQVEGAKSEVNAFITSQMNNFFIKEEKIMKKTKFDVVINKVIKKAIFLQEPGPEKSELYLKALSIIKKDYENE